MDPFMGPFMGRVYMRWLSEEEHGVWVTGVLLIPWVMSYEWSLLLM
jgi:hypothetical protein